MRRRRQMVLAVLAVMAALVGQCAFLAFPAGADGTLVADGGFEHPVVGTGSCASRTFVPEQRIDAWTVTAGSAILERCAQDAPPHRGAQMIFLGDGNKFDTPAKICQGVIGLTPGSSYTVHLFVASGGANSMIAVTWDGELIGNVRAPAGGSTLVWRGHPVTATASANSAALCLEGLPNTHTLAMAYPAVDDVRITPAA